MVSLLADDGGAAKETPGKGGELVGENSGSSDGDSGGNGDEGDNVGASSGECAGEGKPELFGDGEGEETGGVSGEDGSGEFVGEAGGGAVARMSISSFIPWVQCPGVPQMKYLLPGEERAMTVEPPLCV